MAAEVTVKDTVKDTVNVTMLSNALLQQEKKPRKRPTIAVAAKVEKQKVNRKLKMDTEDSLQYQLITLTAGDCAENHARMEQIGVKRAAGQGFTVAELEILEAKMTAAGVHCELVHLSLEASTHPKEAAAVLVIRNGVNALLGSETGHQDMFAEQMKLTYDKKAHMYGRVVNKHLRWNVCFDEESRGPAYEKGMGTIVGYQEVPLMRQLMNKYEEIFGEKAKDLRMESNYYYDTRKTGIGFHGDTERVMVIAARIGHASLPMHFQWFYQSESVGTRLVIPIEPGDVYIMSEKAVGSDWKKKNIMTLRHATGCDKCTTIKSE